MKRKSTSGLLLTENKDGSLRLEYVDYGVNFFGGGDYEVWYEVDKADADKLRAYFLQKYGEGDLKAQMKEAFGENLSETAFHKLCEELGVYAKRNSWVSHDFDHDDFGDLN